MPRMPPPRGRLALYAIGFVLVVSLAALAPHLSRAQARADVGVTFAGGWHARIPFELRTQHIWVRGQVNGSDSVWIVVDSGAGSSVLDEELATSLKLHVSGHHEALGAGGAQAGTSVEDVTIRLPGVSLHRREMDTIDLSAFRAQAGRPMQAIVGHELFEACVVRFDYAAGMIDLWDARHPPAGMAGVAIPLTFSENLPYVDGVLDVPGRGQLRGRFVLDTGSGLALMLAPDVVQRESLATAFPRTLVGIGRGVGGELRNRVGRARKFTLGTLEFASPTVVMPDSGAGRISVRGSLGNIGGQMLGRCRVTFDYSRKLVRFEPGSGFDRPFEADMLGATLMRTAQGLAVRWVNAETPAAEAGLQVGDLVMSIDGEPWQGLDPATLRQRFQVEGQRVRLDLHRVGAPWREVSVKLRRLI